MNYGRLQASQPGGSSRRSDDPIPPPTSSRSKKKLILLSAVAVILIVASTVSAVLLVGIQRRSSSGPQESGIGWKPTQAISRACGKTQFPSLCVKSLLDFPGSRAASEQDLVHISLNMTLQHLSKAFYSSSSISNVQMDQRQRSAYEDCLELLEDSVDALMRSLTSVVPGGGGGSTDDVLTWLSAALTNQDTCSEGFADTSGTVKDQMASNLKDLSELISNCLAIYAGSDAGNDFSGVPIQNKRRLMGDIDNGDISSVEFPIWLSKRDRTLLSTPARAIQADIIVSKDGSGTVKTIAEAIKKVPEHSSRRIIVYVKAGR